ncbi:MAG: BRO family protein [Anaerolineaceae bacterium]|nr:BRO family protein [Anaerolineaceae bacterium]
MKSDTAIKLFESSKIRTQWNEDEEKWYFSVVDIIGVLTEQTTVKGASTYWAVLKKRLSEEGSELLTNCKQLKLMSADGKKYLTDVADTQQLLRIIQSIPSPKAEPFKQWLAKAGSERIDEINDPEKAFERGVATYKRKGYSDRWINQRVKSIAIRKGLTDEWDRSGIKGKEYGILTDEITKATFDRTVKEYKQLKGLKNENLRDNMSDTELIFNMLAEAATKEISITENPKGLDQSKVVARKGGTIAGNARKELEQQTGRKVVTSDNAKDAKLLDSGLIDPEGDEQE